MNPPASEWPPWVKVGAVFAVDGGTEKIIYAKATEIEVVTADGFDSWPLRAFLVALDAGRIIRPAIQDRAKRRTSPIAAGGSKRGRLPEVAEYLGSLPIADATPVAVVRTALLTLQALRLGAPAQPPAVVLVQQLAYAGAYAEGLGYAVAFREGRPGRYPTLQPEAQDAQALLARFSRWNLGDGELNLSDFRTIQHFVLRGLEAYGFTSLPPRRGRGRRAAVPYEQTAIRHKLSRRWRDYCRGTYSARQAMREVAMELMVHARRVSAAWNDKEHADVVLGPDDEAELETTIHRLEVAYYRMHRLTENEIAMYRREIAATLRWLRRIKNLNSVSRRPERP